MIDINILGDVAGKFDISVEEAERIASVVDSEAAFETIWEHDEWWADENQTAPNT